MGTNPIFSEAQIRVLTEWADGFVKAMNDTLRRFAKASKPLVDAVWTGYRTAGSPYGESEEGMLRWLGEQRQIADARWEAERRASIQETCAELRGRRR